MRTDRRFARFLELTLFFGTVLAAGGARQASSAVLSPPAIRAGWHDGGRFGRSGCFGCGWWSPWWGGWGLAYRPYARGYSKWTAIKTDVEPDEASVYLDGRLIGTADDFDGSPGLLYLGPGQYKLEFQLDGFESYNETIEASRGRFYRIEHRLKKIPGAKHYGTYDPPRPAGGIVRYFSKRADTDEPDSPGDGRDREQMRATPPKQEEPARESVEEGRLRFEIEPADAAVYLDGKFAGTARELGGLLTGLAVLPGPHEVIVTRPGYKDGGEKVEASAGESRTVKISLSR